MREKLLNLMKSEGLTSSRLAEILEIQPSGISHILSGRNKPGFDLLQKILRRFPKINPDWLLLDSETMYRDGASASLSAMPSVNFPIAESATDLFGRLPAPESQMQSTAAFSGSSSTSSQPTNTTAPRTGSNSPEVIRVVVFYDDQTFESFVAKK